MHFHGGNRGSNPLGDAIKENARLYAGLFVLCIFKLGIRTQVRQICLEQI